MNGDLYEIHCILRLLQNICTVVLKYEPNEVRSVQKSKVRILSVSSEQLVYKSSIVWTFRKVLGKFSENL